MLTNDPSHLDYLALLKASKRLDLSDCKPLRVAVLSDAATQQLVPLLKVLFARGKIAAEIHHAEFDSIETEILDPQSVLYQFQPQVVVILPSQNALRLRYYERAGDRAAMPAEVAGLSSNLWQTLKARTDALVIQGNYVLPYERTFGHFEQKVPDSLHALTAATNLRLAELARGQDHVMIADVEGIASDVGRRNFGDERLWVVAKSFCALEHLPLVGQAIVDITLASLGRGVKCVVLDLDNTLWGGVVGDDGLEGIQLGRGAEGEPFHRLQCFLLELKRRGVLLAVCSKNEESVARRAFRDHPDMVLREGDISAFVANWDNKADNIRRIRETLNIGFDSMVFLDDNPFERNLVRQYLPEVIVPELPEEPADYLRFLCSLNLFETTTFTDEDRQRADLYRQEADRKSLEQSFTNISDYLRSLQMQATVARFDELHLPRIAQLIQRSNQFNLTTRRYTVAECEAMMLDRERYYPFYVRLRDRFGDAGLISTIVLRADEDRLHVDLWLMSCRVLARGVEEYALNHVVEIARQRGARAVVGQYLPTAKNAMVRDLYQRLGFQKTAEAPDGATTWTLEVASHQPRETFLRPSEETPS
jgi:FkbH-like protein